VTEGRAAATKQAPCDIHGDADSIEPRLADISAAALRMTVSNHTQNTVAKFTVAKFTVGTTGRATRREFLRGAMAMPAAACLNLPAGAATAGRHAIAMHGEPALAAGFAAFRYVDPDAPKGGRLTHGLLGTFDSLNPFIVKGISLPALRGLVFESLAVRGYDEPFTLYGLIARAIETDA